MFVSRDPFLSPWSLVCWSVSWSSGPLARMLRNLHRPRTLHFAARTKCCACHEICTSRFTACCTCYEFCTSSCTKCCACKKSALRRSQNAATKYAHQGSQFVAPATKSALRGAQSVVPAIVFFDTNMFFDLLRQFFDPYNF